MPQVFYLCIKFKTKGKTKHFACQKLEEICTFSFFLMQNIKSNTECGMRLDTTQNRFLERKKKSVLLRILWSNYVWCGFTRGLVTIFFPLGVIPKTHMKWIEWLIKEKKIVIFLLTKLSNILTKCDQWVWYSP